jgi:hypothetical protein
MSNTTITEAINHIETQGLLANLVVELRDVVEREGSVPPTTSGSGVLKLHEAMAVALRQRGNTWTKISDLAHMINAQRLYTKGDGSQVESNQLHARANRPTYRPMFEKDGPMIRLRTGA